MATPPFHYSTCSRWDLIKPSIIWLTKDYVSVSEFEGKTYLEN